MRKNPVKVRAGRLGGSARSRIKSSAARRNGRLGGRPKKKEALARISQNVEGQEFMNQEKPEPMVAFNMILWLDCPWCGEKPKITKHYKHDYYSLVHRCSVFTTLALDWSSLESLEKRWNTRT